MEFNRQMDVYKQLYVLYSIFFSVIFFTQTRINLKEMMTIILKSIIKNFPNTGKVI